MASLLLRKFLFASYQQAGGFLDLCLGLACRLLFLPPVPWHVRNIVWNWAPPRGPAHISVLTVFPLSCLCSWTSAFRLGLCGGKDPQASSSGWGAGQGQALAFLTYPWGFFLKGLGKDTPWLIDFSKWMDLGLQGG